MRYEIYVLRALLRLQRQRLAPTLDAIALRAGDEPQDAARALRRLAKDGLVTLDGSPRLTMMGLVVAAASGRVLAQQKARPVAGAKKRAA